MRMTKKVVSLILAVMMVATMVVVGAVSVSAATTITTAAEFDAACTNGGEYVLGADINLADISKYYSTVPAGVEATIDFADYTLTAYYGIENDGTLTLKASGNGGIAATGIAIDNFGALTVESGTYTSTKSGGYATVWSEEGCNTVIKGGTFTNTSAEGYGVYIFKNSETTINGGTFTAGGWVICGWSQTSNATVTITKGTFTSTGNAVLSGNGTSGANGNTWTIKGGTFNANADLGDNDGYLGCAIYAPNDDTWTISGGTFNVTNGVGVCQRAGTVEIKGGTFNVTGDGTLGKVGDSRVVIPSGSAVVYDSESNYPAQSAEDATTITSGTFNTDQDPIAMVKADDSDPDRVTVTGGTFSGDASDYVDFSDILVKYTNAQGKITYYKSHPLGSCSSGYYKLLQDITTTSYITPGIFGYDVVVDLNGHTYTSSSTRGYAVLASRNGDYKMTIKNGTINYTNADSQYAAVQYQGNSNNLQLENVEINSAVAGIAMLGKNQNLAVTNCTINATDDFALATNGSKTVNGTITVTNSTLASNGSVGVYLPGDADATFTDTNVNGTTAMYIKGGKVTIDGGNYSANGAAAEYSYNGNGCNPTGDAIVVENAGSDYPSPADVTIVDGSFASANGVAVSNPVKDSSLEAIDGFVYGGTYSTDVTTLCAPGLAATETGGAFSIVPFTTDGKADIDGYQQKIAKTWQSSEATGNDINTRGVRIATKVDRAWLDENADDFGYVVAKYTGDKTQAQLNFSNMKKDGGNGEKTISCKDTYNNGVGYGDANEYVTLAVNGMDNGDKAVARFYVVVNGVTYFANYSTYTGILATY